MTQIKTLFTLSLLCLMSTPAMADVYRPGGSSQTTCYRDEYREEYVPGTKESPGYVRRHNERVRVPCDHVTHAPAPVYQEDNNSCIEGAVLGGIAGGGIGAALSRDEGNLIGIPLGIVGGAMVGCQIDGG